MANRCEFCGKFFRRVRRSQKFCGRPKKCNSQAGIQRIKEKRKAAKLASRAD